MSQSRKFYSPKEKVSILKEHLAEQIPVSDLCDKYGLHPTVFYRWHKQFFENGHTVFERKTGRGLPPLEKENQALKEKLQRKNEVLSELMEEHVNLKKTLGAV